MQYYYIKSKKLFAKSKSFFENYLYIHGEWVKDNEHIVSDRIIGYDPHSDCDLYGIGNTDIMEDLEKITEEEFEKRCNQTTEIYSNRKAKRIEKSKRNKAVDWKNSKLSDSELRKLVWEAGSPTVQAPFAQAVKKHLGRDIWDLQKFKDDLKVYLIDEKKLSADEVNRCMTEYDKDMHDFMYHGLSMEDIASAIGI